MINLPILFGYDISGIGNSSVPYELCSHWNQMGINAPLYGPSSSLGNQNNFIRPLFGPLKKKFMYRLQPHNDILKKTEELFFEEERSNPYVYLWAGLSLEIFEKFHANGNKIIIERINCHQRTAREQVDRAHDSLGLARPDNITDQSIEAEQRKLDLADGIFTPSPMVYRSMLNNGIDESKLIPASYGWSPSRFSDRKPQQSEKTTFLFVGTLCVRKGVPLLLEAWQKAAIDGQLILCGQMDETIRAHYSYYFDNETIRYIPYTRDLSALYNSADIFVFPSFEEGGPMVTYEAMAHGLVPVVSEMGAGAIVEHKKNGLITNLNIDCWATALNAVAGNNSKRNQLSEAARNRADQFTWEKVAKRRADGFTRYCKDI